MRMPGKPIRSLLLAATLMLGTFGFAYADPVRLLGSTRLSKAENNVDVLAFASCRADIRALQLRLRKGNAEIEHVWVRFGNGQRVELSVRDRIGRGGTTR